MTPKEEKEFLSKVMQGLGKKGGAARAKSTTKAQRIAWGLKGVEVREAKKGK